MSIFPQAEAIIRNELERFGLAPEALTCGLRTRTISSARGQIRRRLRYETHLTHREIEWLIGLRPDLERIPKGQR